MLHLNVVSQGNLPHTHWDIAMVISKLSSNLITHRHQSAYPWTYSPQNINTCSVTRQLVHPAGWLLGEEKMWHFKLSLGAHSDYVAFPLSQCSFSTLTGWCSHSNRVAFPLWPCGVPLWPCGVPLWPDHVTFPLPLWCSHSERMAFPRWQYVFPVWQYMAFPLCPCGIPTPTVCVPTLTVWRSHSDHVAFPLWLRGVPRPLSTT